MPRKPSSVPSLHKASGQWYFYVKRKPVYLGKDYDKALKRMRALLLAQAMEQPKAEMPTDATYLPAYALASMFLDHQERTRSPNTVRANRDRLARALKLFDRNLPCSEFGRSHLGAIEAAMTGPYSPTTIRDTLAAVIQVFRWACQQDPPLLDTYRLGGYKLPAPNQRNRVITDEEFSSLLKAAVENLPLRHVMVACRLTGCRPGELRVVRWDMVRDGMMVLPRHKTRTMQKEPRPRVIPIPTPLARRLEWMKLRSTSPFIFTNGHGKPYTKDALVRAFARCRARAKIEVQDGENLVLYSHRHTFITRSVGRATDLELSEVTGHTNTRMLKRYTHMDFERLRAIREKLG